MNQKVIIFDGVCKLCNASINFIIKHDVDAQFTFATTQSNYGIKALSELGMDPLDPTTFVLIENNQRYFMSDAVLQIASQLAKPWALFFYLKIVPKFLRDLVYKIIAKYRYKLLGQRDQCMVPSHDLKARFLE